MVSILYVVPVLICLWSPKKADHTDCCRSGVGAHLDPVPLKPPGDILLPLFNQPLSLIAIWTVVGLVDRFNGVRKRAEEERETTIEFLRLVNESRQTSELVHSATDFFQKQSGCEAVGIRLKAGQDYPYCETKGFPQSFVISETNLCAHDAMGKPCTDDCGDPILDCMCGNVIQGRTDPAKPFFTAKGSFWTNGTTELLASTTEVDRQARTGTVATEKGMNRWPLSH